jgi:hypothetical protein
VLAYLNRGFILENAICSLIEEYVETIKFDKAYANFNTRVTLQHPFAHVGVKGAKAADYFPAVVVSTYDDEKPHDLPIRPQVEGLGLNKDDVDFIAKTTETIPDEETGKTVEKKIPGLCVVIAPETLKEIYGHLEKNKIIYGFSVRTYRMDRICLEIWSENVQLKNEIYEQLRLFVIGNLRHLLTAKKYQVHDVKMDDDTINGQRSGAYNDQFGVILAGASIIFDVNYAIEQIVLDTQIKNPNKDLITEVISHV